MVEKNIDEIVRNYWDNKKYWRDIERRMGIVREYNDKCNERKKVF